MSKIRIWMPTSYIKDNLKIEDKETVNKLRNVLRLRKNNEIFIFDGKGKEYSYNIVNIKKEYIEAKKLSLVRKESPPRFKLLLAFPLMREQKLDFLLQKSTELGAFGFIPFISKNTVICKVPSQHKYKRWRKIITEATRQSGRVWIPEIGKVKDFLEVLEFPSKFKFAASVYGGYLKDKDLKDVEGEIILMVGPEGDFTQDEYALLKDRGFKLVKLSPHILRTETAAIFFLGLFNYLINQI